jgi:hypothetical protein
MISEDAEVDILYLYEEKVRPDLIAKRVGVSIQSVLRVCRRRCTSKVHEQRLREKQGMPLER